MLAFRPDNSSTHFTISPASGAVVSASSLNVTDSTASPAITCSNCTLTNTTGWNDFNVDRVWVGGNGTGASKTDWSNNNNWNPNLVPASGDTVDIPGTATAPSQPVLSAASSAKSVQIEDTASIDLKSQTPGPFQEMSRSPERDSYRIPSAEAVLY